MDEAHSARRELEKIMKNQLMQAIIDTAQSQKANEETRQFMVTWARRTGKTFLIRLMTQYRMRFFAWHAKQIKPKPVSNARVLVSRRKREGKY